MRLGPLASLVLLTASFGPAREAHALRFTLGIETALTPLVIEAGPSGNDELRWSLRPVLDVETSRYFAFGVYTPFTLLRAGGESSTGAESIFGAGVSARYPIFHATPPEEMLLFATLRGGLGTSDGRAGLFVGGALGLALTWIQDGWGLVGELAAGHLGIPEGNIERPFPAIDRWTVSLSVGLVFRLGGETWPRPSGPP